MAVTPPQGGHHSTVRHQPGRTAALLAAKPLRHRPVPVKLWQGMQTWANLGKRGNVSEGSAKTAAQENCLGIADLRPPGELTRRLKLPPPAASSPRRLFKATGARRQGRQPLLEESSASRRSYNPANEPTLVPKPRVRVATLFPSPALSDGDSSFLSGPHDEAVPTRLRFTPTALRTWHFSSFSARSDRTTAVTGHAQN